MPGPVLVGIQLHGGAPSAVERQRRALEALVALDDVRAVHLQFHDAAPLALEGCPSLPVLQLDSNRLTGAAGPRKPIAREVFDALASVAADRGIAYFAYINGDIVVRPEAIDLIRRLGRQTYVFSRGDVDDLAGAVAGLDVATTMMTAGQDMFAVSVDWWRRHAARFRPYILGEGCWDNVYTAAMMCHSDGVLLNREPHILHERHPTAWHAVTPAARWNGMLAALDGRYFSIWCRYWTGLEAARRRAASASEEEALRRSVLVWRRSAPAAALQLVRTVKARARYHRLRREWREAPPLGG
jgi:hypothetical protein